MAFIPANVLKDLFTVNAKFYHAEVNGERFLMRREARISRVGSMQSKIDAMVVMVNPGSCQPVKALDHTLPGRMEMLPAKSDATQRQLMILMECMGWNELSIVNLSDICEGNLNKFKAIEKKFKLAGIPHSFFQDENSVEKDTLLSNSEHLIFAWGSSDNAKRLAKEYGLFANGYTLPPYQQAMWLKPSKTRYPRHPKPALTTEKYKWIEDMTSLLDDRVSM